MSVVRKHPFSVSESHLLDPVEEFSEPSDRMNSANES